MAYTQFDYTKPDPSTDSGTNAFTNARKNMLALRDAVMLGIMPGWACTPSGGTAANPAEILYSLGTERVKLAITWGAAGGATGNPVTIVCSYSSNSGTDYDVIGTETITYDASGNFTGSTWA